MTRTSHTHTNTQSRQTHCTWTKFRNVCARTPTVSVSTLTWIRPSNSESGKSCKGKHKGCSKLGVNAVTGISTVTSCFTSCQRWMLKVHSTSTNAFCVKLNCWSIYYYWSLLYSAILRSQADSLRSHVILHEWLAFYSAFLNIHRSGVLTALAWLVPHKTAAISVHSLYTIQPCTMSLHAKPHM